MKKYTPLLLLVFFLLTSYPSFAESGDDSTGKVRIGGYLQTDNRFRMQGDSFNWQEYRLCLEIKYKLSEKIQFYCEPWLRWWGCRDLRVNSDFAYKDVDSPWNVDVREAYIDISGFLSENLDLRIGRQRIAWGTGDKLNPTDNLNPPDLEDIWDFGRHLGSDGIKISYYFNEFTFTGVFIPRFVPGVLPRGDWASAMSPVLDLPEELTLGNITNSMIMPDNNIKESSIFGIKVARTIFDFDFSLSYVNCRDYLPLARKVKFKPTALPGRIDIKNELIYPRMNIVGMDMAGAISDVGIWAEAAMFFPEKIEMTTDFSALDMGTHKSIALDNKPYVKYVVGADYTFKNGIYINGQYLHGFIHERGNGNLHDYFLFGVEKKFLNDKLKISPIQGGIEIKDFGNIKDNYAILFNPEVTYSPVDNLEFLLGAHIIDGKDTTNFGRVKDKDEIYLKVKHSF